ncbi:MAG: DUF6807 family protein [Planctomycetota bacterium]
MFTGRMHLGWAWVAAAAVALMAAEAAAGGLDIKVVAGDTDRIDTPVCVEVPEAKVLAELDMDKQVPLSTLVAQDQLTVTLTGPKGTFPPGQIEVPEDGKARLWFVLPKLEAGKTVYFKAMVKRREPKWKKAFEFQDEKGDHLDLLFAGRKVTRFMYEFEDTDDAKKRFPTAKPFTHVFDAARERVITSPGGSPYPHHRGIFLGYKVGVNGKRYDFWHVRRVWQRVEEIAETEAGPVFGQMSAIVKWEIKEDEPVITEERTITVYRQDKPEVLLDFVATLRSEAGDLDLGGDPEHAGCQFRPHPEVAKRGKETKYVHPPGMKPGRGGTKDMPWSTISFALGDSRFNVAHLNHPDNPKGTIYSAYRPYGRFGAFAPTKLPAGESLTLRYRIYVREGKDAALTVEEAQRLYADFAHPPTATVE